MTPNKHTLPTNQGNLTGLPHNPTPPNTDIPQSASYYQTIFELPLFKFEEVLLTENLNALTITGFPSQQELYEAWKEIMCEYSEAMGNGEYRVIERLMVEINDLSIKHTLINTGAESLKNEYSQIIAYWINFHLRTKYEFKWGNPKYIEDIESCIRRAKGFKVTKELKQEQLKAIEAKMNAGESKQIDKNYFTQMLIILGRYNHYKINKDIFVNEYCTYVNDYASYVDAMDKANKKR
jgi:hypothetical protein